MTVDRAHSHDFGSTQFDARPNADSRFSTIWHGGAVVPVAYGGADREAAASETIFHTIEGRGGPLRPRRVFVGKYLTWQWSTIEVTRELHLVRLDDAGLDVLGTTRNDLITGDRTTYSLTRQWAEALLNALPAVDGFWWMSRQYPFRQAFAFYAHVGGRSGGIAPGDLKGRGPALPFALRAGLDELDRIALGFDITVVRPR
ncbi:MAG: RES family NAD+ phosphorylase [Acidimicrobiia bacterium]